MPLRQPDVAACHVRYSRHRQPQPMLIRDRVKELRRVKASELRPNPRNWRTHPKEQADALRGVLSEVGFAGAALARELSDGSLELIDGHLRAETAPDVEIPVLVLDVTEAESKKLIATFDPIGGMAGCDAEKLNSLLSEVTTDNAALAEMLDSLAHDNPIDQIEPRSGGDELVATTAAEGPTRTAVGDVWVIGGKHRLLVGDCTDSANLVLLMAGRKADLVVSDPPYGVDFKRGQFITDPSRPTAAARGVGDKIMNDDRKIEDQQEFMRVVFSQIREHARPAASVYMWSDSLAEGAHSMFGLAAAGVHIQSQLIWVKNNLVLGVADYHWKHEQCWYGWYEGAPHRWFGERDKTTILEYARGNSTDHPNEKPVDLIAHLIANSSLSDELVIDPFLGSGTTLIAAHRIGRVCYGCELDPRYADLILKRAEAEGLACEKVG